jgi:hypothetical protein
VEFCVEGHRTLACFSLVTGARDSILETRIKISVGALWVQCLERYRRADRLISVDSRKETIGVVVVRILLKEIPSEVDSKLCNSCLRAQEVLDLLEQITLHFLESHPSLSSLTHMIMNSARQDRSEATYF